ncbi:MAG: 50S ribosomal protein L9 [Dehalococcoidales bacterium]
MKVVFLDDVPGVASSGDIKNVADGYARNYLIPRKMALLASTDAIKQAEARSRERARQRAETEAQLREQAGLIEGTNIEITARVGSKERLYGSITSADIARELENSCGVVIDKRKIEMAENIHQLGSYEIAVKLGKDIVPKINVTVVEQRVEREDEVKKEKTVKKEKEETEEKESE